MPNEKLLANDDIKKSVYLLNDLVDSIYAMNQLKIIFRQSQAHDEVVSKHLENVIQEKINKLKNDFSDFSFALGLNNSNNETEP